MVDGEVGFRILEWLMENFVDDLSLVIYINESESIVECKNLGIECKKYISNDDILAHTTEKDLSFDVGFLLWWPHIIKGELLNVPSEGFINTHPSLLPYGRGRNPNFWALKNNTPFGVSLHFVDRGIDSGDIIAQKELEYDWEDNGKSIHEKGKNGIYNLFCETYSSIRNFNFKVSHQTCTEEYHFSKDMDKACDIDLNKKYTARDLLNVLRARTFNEKPSCYFIDNSSRYNVSVEIKKEKI